MHAFDRLLVAQTRSLRRIAGKYAADRTPFADLYQVGFEHLMNVVASAKPQQDGTPLNFRVAAHLSKSLIHYSIRETLSLTSFPKEVLPDLKKNADGSLTLYIQKDSPGADKESNWLPAPNGPIYLVLRLYWPKETPPSILPPGQGTWKPPGIVQTK